MSTARRLPQYLELRLCTHHDDRTPAAIRSAWRSWWLIISLVVLVAFLFSLVLVGVIQ